MTSQSIFGNSECLIIILAAWAVKFPTLFVVVILRKEPVQIVDSHIDNNLLLSFGAHDLADDHSDMA